MRLAAGEETDNWVRTRRTLRPPNPGLLLVVPGRKNLIDPKDSFFRQDEIEGQVAER